MYIVKLNEMQMDGLLAALERANVNHLNFTLGYDPIDNAIKFKVADGVWSPPFPTYDADKSARPMPPGESPVEELIRVVFKRNNRFP